MDLVLDFLDPIILDSLYEGAHSQLSHWACGPRQAQTTSASIFTRNEFSFDGTLCSWLSGSSAWEASDPRRQGLSLLIFTLITACTLYLILGTVCYHKNFDARWERDPKFHTDQVRKEIVESLHMMICSSVLTIPIFLGQLHGYSRIYAFGTAAVSYEVLQYPLFVLFSDAGMYWLHRMFHTPFFFKWMHKHHHHYVIPTPFASNAFHPIEGYVMSLPVYAYSYFLPMSNVAQLVVFVCSFLWTFLMHDNRDQFHTVHHKNVNYNFGQFFCLFDWLFGTYWDHEDFFAQRKRIADGKATPVV